MTFFIKPKKMSEAVVGTIRKKFTTKTYASIIINADTKTVWDILVDFSSYGSWTNSTIMVDDEVSTGSQIFFNNMKSEKYLKLKINKLVPKRKMLCKNIKRRRNFRLRELNSQTIFYMSDTVRCPFSWLFKKKTFSFEESFDDFVNDLKIIAEKRMRKDLVA